jgi:hypothetical protein
MRASEFITESATVEKRIDPPRGRTREYVEWIVKNDSGKVVQVCKTRREAQRWADIYNLPQAEVWAKYPELKPINETHQASQVLAYTKDQHDGFNQDYAITNFPKWTRFQQPIVKLHIPDENGRGENPYGTRNPIDLDRAEAITKDEIINNPIVVDREGWIIDGNHRAYRAQQLNMKTIPAFIPVDNYTEPDLEYHTGRKVTTGLYY